MRFLWHCSLLFSTATCICVCFHISSLQAFSFQKVACLILSSLICLWMGIYFLCAFSVCDIADCPFRPFCFFSGLTVYQSRSCSNVFFFPSVSPRAWQFTNPETVQTPFLSSVSPPVWHFTNPEAVQTPFFPSVSPSAWQLPIQKLFKCLFFFPSVSPPAWQFTNPEAVQTSWW